MEEGVEEKMEEKDISYPATWTWFDALLGAGLGDILMDAVFSVVFDILEAVPDPSLFEMESSSGSSPSFDSSLIFSSVFAWSSFPSPFSSSPFSTGLSVTSSGSTPFSWLLLSSFEGTFDDLLDMATDLTEDLLDAIADFEDLVE